MLFLLYWVASCVWLLQQCLVSFHLSSISLQWLLSTFHHWQSNLRALLKNQNCRQNLSCLLTRAHLRYVIILVSCLVFTERRHFVICTISTSTLLLLLYHEPKQWVTKFCHYFINKLTDFQSSFLCVTVWNQVIITCGITVLFEVWWDLYNSLYCKLLLS